MYKEMGRVNYWKVDRGYGFIHVVKNGLLFKYFLHASNIASGNPVKNALVYFIPSSNSKGPLATNAEIVDVQDNKVSTAAATQTLGGE